MKTSKFDDLNDAFNVETDIVGKYILKFISKNQTDEGLDSILIKTLNNLGLS